MPYDFSTTNPALAAEMQHHDDPPSLLDGEIRLCRALLSQAAANNQPGLCVAIMSCLTRMCQVHTSSAIRLGELLERRTLSVVGQRLCDALVSRLSGLDGYEQLVDVVEADFTRIIREAKDGVTIDAESTEPAENKAADVLPYKHLTP